MGMNEETTKLLWHWLLCVFSLYSFSTSRYYLLAADKAWHGHCLRCCRCSQPLDTELSCFCRGGNIYCKDCRWISSHVHFACFTVWFCFYYSRNKNKNSVMSSGIHSSTPLPAIVVVAPPSVHQSKPGLLKQIRPRSSWPSIPVAVLEWLTVFHQSLDQILIKIFHLVHIIRGNNRQRTRGCLWRWRECES